jgi:hypothetical protein
MSFNTDLLESGAPRMKTGLILNPNPEPMGPLLATVATTTIPTPPVLVEAPQAEWPMADNDRLGCCTIAAEVHVEQAGAIITSEPWTYPGDEAVETTYEKLTGGPDTGLELPQVLVPWKTPGLFGAENGGYGLIHPKDHSLCKSGIAIFGNLYIAVALPAIAQEQFRPDGTGVWELTHTAQDDDIEGGHCVVPVGYERLGVIAVTWGSTVTITWSWWNKYVQQVYTVVPSRFVEKGGDAKGFDLAQLDAFLPVI